MKLQLQMILDGLEKYDPVSNVSLENNALISSVKLLEENQSHFQPDALYISEEFEPPVNVQGDFNVNILLVAKANSSYILKENPKMNLIVINKKTTLVKVFNKVQDIIAVYQQWSTKLFDSLTAGNGLQELINIGHELIGNPMHVFDTSFKLLSHTTNIDVDDPEWNTSQKIGYTSYKSVHKLMNERYVEKVEKSRYPILVPPIIHRYPAILSNITIDDKIVAQLAVLEYERPFRQSDLELIDALTETISLEIQRNKLFRNVSGISYEYFITDLLDGKIKNTQSIAERVRTLSWSLKENFYVLTINIAENNLSNTPLPYLKNLMGNLVMDSRAVLYYEHIVLVINTNRNNPLLEDNMKEFREYLVENRLRCGISRCFHKLEDIRECYEQSTKAIELGIQMKKEDFLLFYEDFAIFHILDIRSDKSDLKKFCHPIIFELIDYDHKNNTNYTGSLYTYLSKVLDIAESAKALYIHYNTMRFRIEKIQSLMNINLKNSHLLLHLHLSFNILEFIGELELIKNFNG